MDKISASGPNREVDGDSSKKWSVYEKRSSDTHKKRKSPFSPSTSTTAVRADIPDDGFSGGSSEDGDAEDENDKSEDTTNEETDESDGEEECKRDVSVILSDLEILDCPICFEPLKRPVFQCRNGHIACGSCCGKMKNKCGNCSLQIGHIRCRVIETLIESVKIPCRYTPHGCSQKLLYKEKFEHEKACKHIPYWCPCFHCSFVGKSSNFIKHIEVKHSYSCKQFTFGNKLSLSIHTKQQRQIILRESTESNRDVVFVLNHSHEALGSLVEVVRTGRTSDDERHSLLLSSRSSNGEHSFKIESVVDNIRKLSATTRSTNFLLIPKKCIDPSGQVALEVTISRGATIDQI